MLLWLDIVIMLSETSGMVYFLTSAVLFLWFSLLDEAFWYGVKEAFINFSYYIIPYTQN